MLDLLDVEWANIEAALEFCAGSPAGAESVRGWGCRWRPICGPTGWCEAATGSAFAIWGRSWKWPRRPVRLVRWPCSRSGTSPRRPGIYDAALAGFEEARRVSEQDGRGPRAGVRLVRARAGPPAAGGDRAGQRVAGRGAGGDAGGGRRARAGDGPVFLCHGDGRRRPAGRCPAAGPGRAARQRPGRGPAQPGKLEHAAGDRGVAAGRSPGGGGEDQGSGTTPGPDRAPVGHGDEPGGPSPGRRDRPGGPNVPRCCWVQARRYGTSSETRSCPPGGRLTTMAAKRPPGRPLARAATAPAGRRAMR